MRSRALQLVFGAVAATAVAGAAVFISISEQHIATTRSAGRAFDAVAREATNGLARLRADGTVKSIDALREMATTDKAKAASEEAASKAAALTDIHRRARDYAKTGLPLMAGDVLFAEGADTASAVLDYVNAARVAEQQAADDEETSQRRLEATVLAGVAIVGLGAIAGVFFTAPVAPSRPAQTPLPSAAGDTATVTTADDLTLRGEPAAAAGYMTSRPAGPVLRAASTLCTDLGRVSDVEELRDLIGRAADLMDASGLIVWMSGPDGAQLVPALSHGYAADMLSKLPPLARSADNAAAKAFRTGQLQLVLARPGASNGAIVAPVLSSNGCVGVISAEIRGGGETSESVQALAAIFAAQLAGVLHTTPEAHETRATGTDNI